MQVEAFMSSAQLEKDPRKRSVHIELNELIDLIYIVYKVTATVHIRKQLQEVLRKNVRDTSQTY